MGVGQGQPAGPRFGVGIETPDSSAVTNGVLNVAKDPGHTFGYIKDAAGNIVGILSFGPGEPIGATNKGEFKSGDLPGNSHWNLSGNVSTWETPITNGQMAAGMSYIAGFKANTPNYTPGLQCTTATLGLASAMSVNLPSGVGPVIARSYGITAFSSNVANPYQLGRDMTRAFGPPLVVPSGIFPRP
jgi:hypothetical protein